MSVHSVILVTSADDSTLSIQMAARAGILCTKHWKNLVQQETPDKYLPAYLLELLAIECQRTEAPDVFVDAKFRSILRRIADPNLMIDFADHPCCRYSPDELEQGLTQRRQAPSVADPGNPTNDMARPRAHRIDWEFWREQANACLRQINSVD